MSWKRDTLEFAVSLAATVAPHAAVMPENPRAIFVLRNNSIGDLLTTTPLFEALRHRFPKTRIVAGIGAWNVDVLANNPFVDEVALVNAPWHNQVVQPQNPFAALKYVATSQEAAQLGKDGFDIGIDVLGSGFGSMLLMRAGIPWRLGVKGYAGGHSATQQCIDFREDEHVAHAALRFAELLGATQMPEARPQIFLGDQETDHHSILFAPGGGFPEKCWPIDHFAALATRLAPRPIIVIGSRSDQPAGARLAATGSHVRDLTGQLSLRETFSQIAGASRIVCNSSMAMHAAAAFHKPCLVLLGGFFPSARQHALQWGYPETRILGPEGGNSRIATVDEAFSTMENFT